MPGKKRFACWRYCASASQAIRATRIRTRSSDRACERSCIRAGAGDRVGAPSGEQIAQLSVAESRRIATDFSDKPCIGARRGLEHSGADRSPGDSAGIGRYRCNGKPSRRCGASGNAFVARRNDRKIRAGAGTGKLTRS
jgi:hypothetical protein